VVVTARKVQFGLCKGLFFSSIAPDDCDTLFILPPRYRGH